MIQCMAHTFVTLPAVTSDSWLQGAMVLCFLLTMGGLAYGITVFRKQAKLIEDLIARSREHESRAANSSNDYEVGVRQKIKLEADMLSTQTEIAKLELSARKAEFDEGGVPHAELNKIHAGKMRRELDLLEVQIELARRDLALRGDHLAYHDCMMEKVKLEIESLKLQVREQRKRLDEF
jgi:hypothetical protein